MRSCAQKNKTKKNPAVQKAWIKVLGQGLKYTGPGWGGGEGAITQDPFEGRITLKVMFPWQRASVGTEKRHFGRDVGQKLKNKNVEIRS